MSPKKWYPTKSKIFCLYSPPLLSLSLYYPDKYVLKHRTTFSKGIANRVFETLVPIRFNIFSPLPETSASTLSQRALTV